MTEIPGLDVRILNKSFWTMGAQTAAQFRKGRTFLVGDAAHRLPPTGGFGMNTGIQDVHNLAWKLAYVIEYGLSDQLLNTYQAERLPVAKQNISWSVENANRYIETSKAIQVGDFEKLKIQLLDQKKNLESLGLDLGFIYGAKTLSVSPSQYIPTSLPGSRAPHIKLIHRGAEISSLDLFEKDFVLLTGYGGKSWYHSASELAEVWKLPLKGYQITSNGTLVDPEEGWSKVYGLSPTDAVLVRPDGHIAWRSKRDDAGQSKVVLSRVLRDCFQGYSF
jgi:putative polyketide hydroxylase